MHLLSINHYDKAAPLLKAISHHTVLRTILAGSTPGHVYVNDPAQPTIAFAQFKHRAFIAGDPNDLDRESIRDFFNQEVIANCRQSDVPLFRLTADDPALIKNLADVLKNEQPILAEYQCFEINLTDEFQAEKISGGFSIQNVTKTLISKDFHGRDDLLEEMCSERESVDAFLDQSFGIAALNDNVLAGWCLSEYNHENRCEVGIATMPPFQHQGLAKAMTHNFLNLAKDNGISTVLWHCFKSNEASRRTALSAGFDLVEDQQVLMVYLDPAIHLAVHGNLYFEEKEYQLALTWYQQALQEDHPQAWMAWNAACAAAHLGQIEYAFNYLHRAVDLGFGDLDHLVQSEHLTALRSDKRWADLITRLSLN